MLIVQKGRLTEEADEEDIERSADIQCSDGVKWKKPVVPGDTLVMEVEILKWTAKFGIAKASGKGFVDGKLAVDVKEMTFALAK